MPVDVSSNSVVRFGVFEADLRSGELRRSGVRVKLQELPFQALKLLLSRPNEVLSREQISQQLWPEGVHVDFDRGVISAINRLREALRDSADNPVFIETVGRRGYRWIAPTQTDPGPQTTIAVAEEFREAQPVYSLRWFLTSGLLLLAVLFLLWSVRSRRDSAHHSTDASSARPNASSISTSPLPSSAQPPANREAEDFYLKGRYYWEKRTPDSLNKAVDSFTQAIVHDPNYAPAYVGLANCYNLLREYTAMSSSEAYPRALAAAKKAVELDGQSSEAHASLAFVSFNGMWDVPTAEREFRRALELNPNNAAAHHWYATYLMCLRRYPEALAEIQRAQDLDPSSKSVLADKGFLLFDAGKVQEATALLKQMEENEPDFISPHRYLKNVYLLTGDYPHYLAEAKSEAELMHDASAQAIAQATQQGFDAAGARGLLLALNQQEQKLYDRGLFSPYYLAESYSLLGANKEALRYLKIASDQHADGVPGVACNHAFDKLHEDPAFTRLLADVGLQPRA
jgi:DNA-binding winged helix-turn-helix (wHTH) protein/Tfp pilus assembly protein PilF